MKNTMYHQLSLIDIMLGNSNYLETKVFTTTLYFPYLLHSLPPTIVSFFRTLQSPFSTVLGSYGCYNEVPNTGWIPATEIHGLIVLEPWSLKTRCWQHHVISDCIVGLSILSSSSFWSALAILGAPWHHSVKWLSSPCVSFASFSSCACVFCVQISFYKDTILG